MRRYLPRIGAAIVAIISITLGLVPIVHSWPRWVLVIVGVLALIGVVLQSLNEVRQRSQQSGPTVHQKLKAGDNSRNIQAGGNVHLDGGMGDQDKR